MSEALAPRKWQLEALEGWKKNARRGIVEVVTGGGKTIFALQCIRHFLTVFPEGRVGIIVPTTALLDQWVVAISANGATDSVDIACYSGEEKSKSPARFNVLVINTARRKMRELSTTGTWMLVVDECHRAGSEMNALALRGTYSATLGLSATPQREYDSGFCDWIQPFLGPIIYSYDYLAASQDDVISKFALHNVRVKMLSDEQASYDRFSRRIRQERVKIEKGVGSDMKLTRLLQQRGVALSQVTMRIPVAVKLAEANTGRRAIIFHESIKAADTLHEILSERSRSATIYHAQISPHVRRDNLRLYRKGVVDILVCCRALDEGINVPETEVAIIASSTASVRQRIQRLGRVLRPAKGKEVADIYTIYASDLEETRLLKESQTLGEVARISWSKVS